MSEVQSWPPGWFPDPTGRHDHRWWDGAAWTGHVADAGVAALDPLDGASASGVRGVQRTGTGTASPGRADGVAVAATAVGIGAVPLALLPVLGLVPSIAAVVLAVVARARLRASGRSGSGLALAGLVLGIVAVAIATTVTVAGVLLLSGSGGELSDVFRAYIACLEVSSVEVCRTQLEESVTRIAGR
jgi:hypothetical protein